MPGPRHRAPPGDRVVDGIQTGGAHRRGDLVRSVGIFLAQPPDRVIEVRQQFVGRQFHVRERADGGAQSAHRGRGVDAVSDHISDDEGHPGARQLDHVEPVAPHAVVRVSRHIARGHIDGGASSHMLGEQVALEREGRGTLAGVLESVVQAERGPGDELLGEEQVIVLERRQFLGAAEQRQSQHATPRTDGYDHQRVDPAFTDLLRPRRIVVDPGAGIGVQHRFQVRPARAQGGGE